MMEFLKECPFCGGNAVVAQKCGVHGLPIGEYVVICSNGCCEQRKRHQTKDKAMEAWNTRSGGL